MYNKWVNRAALSLLMALGLSFLFSCSEGGEGFDMNFRGYMGPISYIDELAPDLPTPNNVTISVRGRNTDEFPVTFFNESEIPGTYKFEIQGVPKLEDLVFRVAGNGLEDSSTFPVLVDPDRYLYLTGLPSGLRETVMQRIVDTVLGEEISFGTHNGAILGVISPEGSGCPTISRVELLDLSGEVYSSAKGPYYFGSNGSVRTNSFGDEECNFWFFEVTPGAYDIRYVSGTGNDPLARVVVFGDSVSVGYKIPAS